MKKLAIIITSLVLSIASIQSHAAIINLDLTQASYAAGDTVLLDLTIQDISADTAELGFNLSFDDSALLFNSFDFSADVLGSALLTFADLSFFDTNIIEVFVLWLDSSDLPATSFSLGQASFTATEDFNANFDVTAAYLANVEGEDIDYPTTSVSVPAPATALLMAIGFLMLPLQRKLNAK